MSPETLARGGPRPKPGTLNELFFTALERDLPDALRFKRDGSWIPISHHELGERVRHAARGLEALGARPGDRIALLSENRPEWAIADYACLTGRFVDVPVYPTLPADQVVHVLRDSGAIAIFVSTTAQARKIESIRGELPALRTVISFVPTGGHAEMTLAELEAHGCQGETEESIAAYRANALQARPDDLATIIYTAGTTGVPKGVMLSHDNLHSNVLGSAAVLPFVGEDSCLSLLPMSHSFERMAGHYMMFSLGIRIAYAESIEALRGNMLEVKPTLLLAVPRLYEKIYARIKDSVAKSSFLKRAIFEWAINTGRAANVYRERNEPLPPGLAKKVARADKLVFRKLKDRVGGRLRFFVSGGAALSREIEEFFWAAGITILQGYGLTETAPVCNVNLPAQMRFGSVGRVVPGVTCHIETADWVPAKPRPFPEGEICYKGPNVFQGYWKNDKATKECFDDDGWFHTGDIGYVDAEGYLFITDRKKEIIVMSNGKKVPPQAIENALKMQSHIAQAMVVGDDRNYIAALIVLNWETIEKFALANGIGREDKPRLVADQRIVSLIEREVEAVNKTLSRYEQIKKFWILPAEWTVDSGELTPSLKLKRRIILDKQKDAFSRLYPGAEAVEVKA